MVSASDRRHTKIFTLDRALLLGVLSVGAWIGSSDLRGNDLEARLHAIEPVVAELKIEAAVIRTQNVFITEQLRMLGIKIDTLLEAHRMDELRAARRQ